MKRLNKKDIQKFLTDVVSGKIVDVRSYHVNIKTNENTSLTSIKKSFTKFCKDNNIVMTNINICNTDVFNNKPSITNKKLYTIYIGDFVLC